MKLRRLALAAGSLVTLSLGIGCGDLEKAAKDATTEALGVGILEASEQEQILTDSGATAKLEQFKIHGSIEIKENFPADLTQEAEVEVPISMPQPEAFAGESRSLLFLRAKEFTVADTKVTRLEVVTVASISPSDLGAKLGIKGGEFTAHLDDDQKPTKATQTGKYILAEGKGTGGLVFIKGMVNLKKVDGTTELVKGAMVYSDASPFVTVTGSKGEFVLPVPEGADGNLYAFHKTIATDYTAPGTPTLSTNLITKAGLLDQYKDDVSGKLDDLGAGSDDKTKALGAFDDLNTAVTDFFDAWQTVAMDLVFVQPPQTPPSPPPAPSVPAETPDPAPVASDTAVVATREKSDAIQVDMGCTGVDANGASTFVTDGSKFDSDTVKGWRVKGHVASSVEQASAIFGDPTTIRADAEKAKRFVDKANGYCVIATGNGLKKSRDEADTSKDNSVFLPEKNMVSEMWQKVDVPSAESGLEYIKIRVAFFSQEFPKWVGSGFNDSFFVKFEESTDVIGKGNLNDLAGGADQVSDCKSKTFTAGTQVTCGEWQSITGSSLTSGALWNIDKSTDAVKKGTSYHCGDGNCYHGYIPARVICKKIPAELQGKRATLRFNVSDAGDKYYDSALAVDSVVFSKEDCDQSAFNGDARSKALSE